MSGFLMGYVWFFYGLCPVFLWVMSGFCGVMSGFLMGYVRFLVGLCPVFGGVMSGFCGGLRT